MARQRSAQFADPQISVMGQGFSVQSGSSAFIVYRTQMTVSMTVLALLR
jgi:hypothetical protein